jgi:hypothetical protein
MNRIKVFILIGAVAFLVTCEKTSFSSEDFPIIKAVEVTDITENGVILRGEVIATPYSDVVDFGLVWGGSRNLNAKGAFRTKFSLGNSIKVGNYSKEVDWDLLPGKKYYFKMYVELQDQIIYSNPIEFVSLGSLWNPWVPSEIKGDRRFPDFFQTSIINQDTYLCGNDRFASVLESSNDSFRVIFRLVEDIGARLLFLNERIAYFPKNLNVGLRRFNLEAEQRLPPAKFDKSLRVGTVHFRFCEGDFCYSYFGPGNRGRNEFLKYNTKTEEFKIITPPPEKYVSPVRVYRWNEHIFLWSGNSLWEYQPEEGWSAGNWIKWADSPNNISFSSVAYQVKDVLIVGLPKKQLWEFSFSKKRMA